METIVYQDIRTGKAITLTGTVIVYQDVQNGKGIAQFLPNKEK